MSEDDGTINRINISYPTGGSFLTSETSKTGAIKITLPNSWSDSMLRVNINVSEYSDEKSFELTVGGLDSSDDGGQWKNTFASLTPDSRQIIDLSARFGHDSEKTCIFIGEVDSSWSYPQIIVTEFEAKNEKVSNYGWYEGWKVEFVTEFDTIDSTVEFPTVWHTSNDGPGSGLDADTLDTIQGEQFTRRDGFDHANTVHINSANNEIKFTSNTFTIDVPSDFVLKDSTESVQNLIWRDQSAGKLYFGTNTAAPVTREDMYTNGGFKYWNADDVVTSTLLTQTGSGTWDMLEYQSALFTASGSTTVTISNASSTPVGTSFNLIVVDAAGASITITASPTPKYPNGVVPFLNGISGQYLVLSFVHVGSGQLLAAGANLA